VFLQTFEKQKLNLLRKISNLFWRCSTEKLLPTSVVFDFPLTFPDDL